MPGTFCSTRTDYWAGSFRPFAALVARTLPRISPRKRMRFIPASRGIFPITYATTHHRAPPASRSVTTARWRRRRQQQQLRASDSPEPTRECFNLGKPFHVSSHIIKDPPLLLRRRQRPLPNQAALRGGTFFKSLRTVCRLVFLNLF